MNLRPGSLPRLLVCHSRRAGFSDLWPTIGFCTTASLKWSTTAAMANAPPSLSYKLDSVTFVPPRRFLEASQASSLVHFIGGRTPRTARCYAEPPCLGFHVAAWIGAFSGAR